MWNSGAYRTGKLQAVLAGGGRPSAGGARGDTSSAQPQPEPAGERERGAVQVSQYHTHTHSQNTF